MERYGVTLMLTAALALAGCDKGGSDGSDEAEVATRPAGTPEPHPAGADHTRTVIGRAGGEDVTIEQMRKADGQFQVLWTLFGRQGALAMIGEGGDAVLVYHLLVREAKAAGVETGDREIAKWLADAECLPGRPMHAAVMAALKSRGVTLPERALREAIGPWLTVCKYFESVHPDPELAESVVWAEFQARTERMTVRAATIKSDPAAEPRPPDEKVRRQFAQRKDQLAGQPSPDNPFGFGYKTPNRVSLRYLFIDRDKIAETIRPTERQTYEWFLGHRDQLRGPAPDAGTASPTTRPAVEFEVVREAAAERLKSELVDRRVNELALGLDRLARTCPPGADDPLAWALKRFGEATRLSAAEHGAIASAETGLRPWRVLRDDATLGMAWSASGPRELISMAFSCNDLADAPAAGAMRIGEIGPPMTVATGARGAVLWQLSEAARTKTPSAMTDQIEKDVVEDLKRKQSFERRLAQARAAAAEGDLDALAAKMGAKVEPDLELRRLPAYQFGLPALTGAALQFGALPDDAEKALLDAAFSLVPPEPGATAPSPSPGIAVVPLPHVASVAILAFSQHTPADRAEFDRQRKALVGQIQQYIQAEAAMKWYRRDEVFRRTSFAPADG